MSTRELLLNDKVVFALSFPEDASGNEVEFRFLNRPGLVLHVLRGGRKTWKCHYRVAGAGKAGKRKVRLGMYPRMSVAAAGRDCEALLERVSKEGDVVALDKKSAEEEAKLALTFADLLDEYVKERHGVITIGEIERELRKDAIPKLGGKRPSEITTAEIDEIGRAIKARGSNAMAARFVMHIKALYNFVLIERPSMAQRYLITNNPAERLGRRRRGGGKSKSAGEEGYARGRPRTRTLDDGELKRWAAALDATGMREDTRLVLKLILVTAQRPGEVRQVRRRDLKLDVDKPYWLIPAHIAKNGIEHLVPLSPLAVSLFKQALAISASKDLVFTNPKDPEKHIANVVLPSAQANLFRTVLTGMSPCTAHDLRRTAATGMRRLRVDRDTVSLILNHVSTGVTARHYDHHEGEEEKREALVLWAVHLGQLLAWSAVDTKPTQKSAREDALDAK